MNLTEYVKRVSWEDFGLSFKHKAVWNKRLKSSGGRFFPKDGHLDFNPHLYEAYGLDVFRKIVRHELCHYHLYFAQKGYRHQDRDFKELLAAVGGLRYAPKMAKTQACYTYICSWKKISRKADFLLWNFSYNGIIKSESEWVLR